MSSTPDWQSIFQEELDRRRGEHLFRARRSFRPIDATHVESDAGERLINFASNNYLGLTHHPRVLEAIRRASESSGAGSGAAGLITGYTDVHASAERSLAAWKGTEAAVLLPSGYQANHAIVQTLAGLAASFGGIRFLVDKLVHASLVDAVRGSGLPFRVFPHNGLAKLRRLLEEGAGGGLQVVVTESIFSMDGDAADLHGLAALKREHPFLLVLDEAHAAGVYGPAGAGLAAELGLQQSIDVSVATLSKALGCVGGVVCASRVFCDALVNFGRAYVFSTSVPPFVATAAEAAVGVLRDEPHRQTRVRQLAKQVRSRLKEQGGGGELATGDSPILPFILGEAEPTLRAADQLLAEGLLVLGVRPPTVPRGSSRLRMTLSSEHTDEEIDRLLAALERCVSLRATIDGNG